MSTSQPGLGAQELIIVALAALVLAACGTTRYQGQTSTVETAPATDLEKRNAESPLKSAAAHSRSST
jgi:hypothetical protein